MTPPHEKKAPFRRLQQASDLTTPRPPAAVPRPAAFHPSSQFGSWYVNPACPRAMHSDRVLHRRLQEFVFVIGTQRECTIHFAREFTTIDELTSHLFLPALRTKTFHHRNTQCITAKSTCRGPVWVKRFTSAMSELCPLFTRSRPNGGRLVTSVSGHLRTALRRRSNGNCGAACLGYRPYAGRKQSCRQFEPLRRREGPH
jgi:hypothetical protein